MSRIFLVICTLAAGFWGTNALAQLKTEPGPGTLACGQTVLVDPPPPPKGKIKQVTGGCNISSAGANISGAARQRKCVSR